MKKLCVFFCLLAAWQVNAQVTIAYCKFGGGCKLYQTSYSYAQVDGMLNYLGTFEKSKGILVFFKNQQNQDTHYPDNKRSPRQLHEYFGGKGEPNIAKGAIAPFQEAIQPESGNWEAITEAPTTQNCPAQLEPGLKSAAGVRSGKKNFKRPFSPDELFPNTPWVTTSPNKYRAIILPETQPAFKTIYEFEVVSPKLIKGTSLTVVNMGTQGAACSMKTNFTFKHKN